MIYAERTSHRHTAQGSIEVICGSMFSGKTEELMRRLRRAQIARKMIIVFKPILDNRHSETEITSHDKNSLEAIPLHTASEIVHLSTEADVIGIDEAQFFDKELVNICKLLANSGKRIIIAGLDMDYRGNPFGPIPELCAIAEEVHKVHAICIHCGSPAYISHRLIENEQKILIGASEIYEPICRNCYKHKTK